MNHLALLSPISDLAPCGPSLEYDHEFAVLLARLVPQADAQYGSFTGTPEAPNWTEIGRECQRLLLRTKDINLMVWLCRARTRLDHSAGLAQTLSLLLAVLEAWPDAVHPQHVIEGELEPAVRANALAALADPEGLLGDVLDLAVSASAGFRLTVREVERALAVPPKPEALDAESVRRRLHALHQEAQGDPQAPIRCLSQAASCVRDIDAWSRAQLGEDAPSLRRLTRVLDLFTPLAPVAPLREPTPVDSPAQPSAEGQAAAPPPTSVPAAFAQADLRSRGEVLLSIRSAREWFDHHEPSSPVATLLKQAERLVGKRFSQVADAIPMDLLQKWETESLREDAS